MRLYELFEQDKPHSIDVANEVAEKLFMTDGNGNPIIGQFIPGYEGMNYQKIVALAKTAASQNPRKERQAIDALVSTEIQKHQNKAKQPAPDKTAPAKTAPAKTAPAKPAAKKAKASNKAKPSKAPTDDKEPGMELKGVMGKVQNFVTKSVKRGTKFADRYTKGV